MWNASGTSRPRPCFRCEGWQSLSPKEAPKQTTLPRRPVFSYDCQKLYPLRLAIERFTIVFLSLAFPIIALTHGYNGHIDSFYLGKYGCKSTHWCNMTYLRTAQSKTIKIQSLLYQLISVLLCLLLGIMKCYVFAYLAIRLLFTVYYLRDDARCRPLTLPNCETVALAILSTRLHYIS